ncbi:hypothetical protein BH09DEP1_BH09DEP1_2060 [soil metagenome]
MNKSHSFLLFFIALSGIAIAMDKPVLVEPDIVQIARYGNTQDFKDMLNSLPSPSSAESLKSALHALAHPFTYTEQQNYTLLHKTYCTTQQIARQHAFKADLLLRKYGPELLFQKNSNGQTSASLAAELAAKNDYLPVLARIMLSVPADSPFKVRLISHESTDTLINYFFEMISIKHLYPTILADLSVNLPQKELIKLYEWAEKAKIERLLIPKNLVLKQLTRKQLNGLFEYYLAYDIQQQYQANRGHPQVEAYFCNNYNPPIQL